MQEACVKNNATSIKPERKSRVTSVEQKKAKADENQQEEVTSLLNHSEPTERKIIGAFVVNILFNAHSFIAQINFVF